MSEKTLWRWLRDHGFDGLRIEGCSTPVGMPDVITPEGFVELKDWSGNTRHTLTREQLSFLEKYGGSCIVKTKTGVYQIKDCFENLLEYCPEWVEKHGRKV